MPDEKPALEKASQDHMAATVDYFVFGAENLLGNPMSAAIALAVASSYFARRLDAEEREAVSRMFENGTKMFPVPVVETVGDVTH